MGISYSEIVPRFIKKIEDEIETCPAVYLALYTSIFQFNFNELIHTVHVSNDALFSHEPVNYEKHQKELHLVLLDNELPTTEAFAKAKYYFQELFLHITKRGTLQFVYKKESLLTSKEMQHALGVGRTTLHRYVQSGMEIADGYGHEGYGNYRYPKENVFYKKNKKWDTLSQSVIQKTLKRNQSFKNLIHELKEKVDTFEVKYKKPFQELFVTEEDILNFEYPNDYKEWKKAIEDHNNLLEQPI